MPIDVHEHGRAEGSTAPRHARSTPTAAADASSRTRVRAMRASTASAAWRPESRLPPPARASACSMVSTVSTPNAHGTPVVQLDVLMPRAALAADVVVVVGLAADDRAEAATPA